jgi:hypothetical protein
MRTNIVAAIFTALTMSASAASADVRLTIENGHVNLSATDATVRQILAEWARVGQTTIVNADRIAGGPVTLELANVPEEQALDVILRSVSGYLAALRATMLANASRYDRILVMPTSTGTRPSAAPPPPPTFQQPQFIPPPGGDNDDEEDDAPPNRPMPNPRIPIFNTFPQPPNTPRRGVPNPNQAAPDGNVPRGFPGPGTAPIGVAVPGMIVPAPAQPGQPGVPGTLPQGVPQND